MVTRTWACLNRHCQKQFDHEEDYPACPRCGGARTKWLPKPFGILSASTKNATKTAESLASDFSLTNFRSPERERNNIPSRPSAGSIGYEAPGMPGWRANIPTDAAGNPMAACIPTGVTAPLRGRNLIDGPQPKSKVLGAGSQTFHAAVPRSELKL